MSNAEDRQVRMETLLAHLQQDIELINGSLTHQLKRMQEMDQRVARIERELELLHQPTELRDPQHEQPPHYYKRTDAPIFKFLCCTIELN